jgi:galactose mutarotase-like enzyme
VSQPVTIENDAVQMQVWPTYGGKISSIMDKADRFELLFNYPVELPTTSHYDIAYPSGWYAGWDECFPAIAPGRYPGHPYDGIGVPDHGELWGIPTVAVPTKDGITTVWHGLRFGYRLTRKLYLAGAGLTAEYKLVNLAPFDLHFVWAAHALMNWPADVEIDLGDCTACRFSHDADGKESGETFAWPRLGGQDLSKPDALPTKHGWKAYSAHPIAQRAIVRYPSRGRQVGIAFSSNDATDAYWGVWINTGGWAGHKHVAIEPTMGRYDALDRSVRDGSAGRVSALGNLSWSLSWTLTPIGGV